MNTPILTEILQSRFVVTKRFARETDEMFSDVLQLLDKAPDRPRK